MRHQYQQRAWVLIALSLVFLLSAALGAACLPSAAPPAGQGRLTLAVLDVGQGDGIFLRSPAGKTMLVDAGNESADARRVILPYLRDEGVTALDYLVLTHPDQDHVGGMPALLREMAVGAFVDSVQPGVVNQAYERTLDAVARKKVKAIKARRGQTTLDLGPGVQVEVLGPEEPLLTVGRTSPENNNSVVLRVTYGQVRLLLTGDIETEGEERIMSHREDLRAQVLKVAHHGSRFSSGEAFLQAVRPEVALISAGVGNPYGHPHRELLRRLQQDNIKTYRTDQHGTIVVTTDGLTYRVTASKQSGRVPPGRGGGQVATGGD